MGGVFFLLLAAFVFEQARAHDLDRRFLVFLLAASVLAADDPPGRDVHDLDGGVGRVHALAAGAARAADFDPEILGFEIDVHLLGFRQHGDGGGGGVDPALGLGRRHTLHPMDPTLVAETPENRCPGNPENHLAKPSEVGRARVHLLNLETERIGIPGIHAEKIGREKSGLGPAGAGPDFHDGVAVFVRLRRKKRDLDRALEFRDPGLEFRDFQSGEFGHFLVVRGSQFAVLIEFPPRLDQACPEVEQGLRRRVFAQDVPCVAGIVEQAG